MIKEQGRILRHGDILFREVTDIPKNARNIKSDIVAMGEKTGHHHKLVGAFQMYESTENGQAVKYIDISQQTRLTHQEHNTLDIPQGKYVIVNEREYDPFSDVSVNEIRTLTRSRDVSVLD